MMKYVLPLFAAGMLAFATRYVAENQITWPRTAPATPPPKSPFANTLAGAGLVEPETESIAIGAPLPGVVVEVFAAVGKRVKANQPLFRLDDRQQLAQLKVQEAALAAADADLKKLQSEPRPEQVPVAEAHVRELEANLADQRYQNKRIQDLFAKGVATEDERVRREQAEQMAEARLAQAKAECDLLKSGAWEHDKNIARSAVERARSQVQQARTELDRLTVRAQVDGEVLKVNVRPGEFVGAPPGQPLIVLGNIDELHVRVDIDEYDIPRFRQNAPALATLKGSPDEQFPLHFVRVEPYVIPKKSLTGDNIERVDTRVLQVIYRLDIRGKKFFVGQQLDAFIQTEASASQPAAVASSE